MTIPYQMNCAHSPDGWCLACVGALAAERDEAREALQAYTDATGIVEKIAAADALGRELRRYAELEKQARERAAGLEAALRQVEWVWSGGASDEASCPWCGGDNPNHSGGCPRQAALAGADAPDAGRGGHGK